MKFLDLPTEILQPICRLLVAKNSGVRCPVYVNSTICLKYTADTGKLQLCDRLERAFYNAELQVLRVCRRLLEISAPIIYGEHRFACLQPESFMTSFAGQIGESNLQTITRLHLREPKRV